MQLQGQLVALKNKCSNTPETGNIILVSFSERGHLQLLGLLETELELSFTPACRCREQWLNADSGQQMLPESMDIY